jgi:hypothetical protein
MSTIITYAEPDNGNFVKKRLIGRSLLGNNIKFSESGVSAHQSIRGQSRHTRSRSPLLCVPHTASIAHAKCRNPEMHGKQGSRDYIGPETGSEPFSPHSLSPETSIRSIRIRKTNQIFIPQRGRYNKKALTPQYTAAAHGSHEISKFFSRGQEQHQNRTCLT